jgi:ketopantoate reductase
MTEREIVLIGIGEIGGVFARGFLRLGITVHPVTRDTDMQALSRHLNKPTLVLVAVGENALQPLLSSIPECWRDRLCLVQNELLPNDWQEIVDPTVISIWFEKKPGMDVKVIMPSPVYGPSAALICQALQAVNIPCTQLENEHQLLQELVVKNLYILTTNIAGLVAGGTVDELWRNHRQLAQEVATETLQLQTGLTGEKFETETLMGRMLEAFAGDPDHKCMGRSAPARLARALQHAERLKLELPALRRIANQTEMTA